MPFRIRSALILAVVTMLATRAEAQTTDRPRGPADPRIWISASAGPTTYTQLNYLNKVNRQNVGSAMSVRGEAQIDVGRIGGFGIAVTTANLPLDYFDNSSTQAVCFRGCPGNIRATSVLATLHVGGGVGLEQVIEGALGFTTFGDLETTTDASEIRKAATNFAGMVGIGASYGFTPQLSVILIGDLGLTFHSAGPEEESGQAGDISHSLGVRAGLRYGLWSRAR